MARIRRRLRDPIGSHRRRHRATRRVGIGQRCVHCGESRPEALIPHSTPMTCAQCRRRARGQCETDDHHVAGAANDPLTLPIPVNDHRAELSGAQEDWPTDTRENPTGDPLLAGAARIRGAFDTLIYFFERMILWTAELLERAAAFLAEKLGPRWWVGTALEAFAPKTKV